MLLNLLAIAIPLLPLASCGAKDGLLSRHALTKRAAQNTVAVVPVAHLVPLIEPRATSAYNSPAVTGDTCAPTDTPCSDCSNAIATIVVCASIDPSFAYGDATEIASCLCYDWSEDGTTSTWVGPAFDQPLSACADYAQTVAAADELQDSLSTLQGFCKSISTEMQDTSATTTDVEYATSRSRAASTAVRGSGTSTETDATTTARPATTATSSAVKETVTVTSPQTTDASSTSSSQSVQPATGAASGQSVVAKGAVLVSFDTSVVLENSF